MIFSLISVTTIGGGHSNEGEGNQNVNDLEEINMKCVHRGNPFTVIDPTTTLLPLRSVAES